MKNRKSKTAKRKSLNALSLRSNFPRAFDSELRTLNSELLLHEPISAAIGLSTLLSTLFASFTTAGVITVPIAAAGATVGGMMVTGAIGIALSAASSLLTTKPQAQTSMSKGGMQINTRMATDPKRVTYGDFCSGGVWCFADTTSLSALKRNDLLHIIIDWGEGEQVVLKDLEQPFFDGQGQSGLKNNRTYTGSTWNKYVVKIQSGTTFKWSDDGGSTWEATGVTITGGWQALNNGVQIKFQYTSGYTTNDSWQFFGADGLWIGDRLFQYYQDINNAIWAWHTFHAGTPDQTVDTGLQGYFPKWTNPKRRSCYSYVRLKWYFGQDTVIWKGDPVLRLRRRKVDLYDPRTGVKGYSNNRALVWLDYKTSRIYGEAKAPSYIDLDSVEDLANWYEAEDCFHFNGAIVDQQEFGDTFDAILDAGRAFIVDNGATEKIKVWDDDAAVMDFADFDKQVDVDPKSFSTGIPGIPETPNRVICGFINPQKDWAWDEQKDEDDAIVTVMAAGNLVEDKRELFGITNPYDAKRIAKFKRLRAKHGTRDNLLLHPKCYVLDQGEMFTATHGFPGWTNEKVRIETWGTGQQGLIQVGGVEEAVEIYDLTVNIDTTDEYWPSATPTPGAGLPSQITGVTVRDNPNNDPNLATVGVIVSWTDNDAEEGVTEYEVQYVENQTPGTVPSDDLPSGGGGFGYDAFGTVPFGFSTTKNIRVGT